MKLSSLIGDTEDLLLASDFLADADDRLLVEARFLLVEADVGRLTAELEGVAFAFGLGVPLIGLEDRFAGVGVCLAMLNFEFG